MASRLTPLYPTRNGHIVCRCSCGNLTSVAAHNLRSGHTRSCGCLAREVCPTNLALGRTKLGVDANGAKLNDDAVREIRRLYESGGISQQAIANQYGMCQMQISKIVRRVDWRHVV